jgi:predicted RND superfamily exporter protein
MHRYLEASVSILTEALLFNLGAAAIGFVILLFFRVPMTNTFGFILLIESTGLMLVGGALGLAGQATAQRLSEVLFRQKFKPDSAAKTEFKAALYSLTGLLLFVEGGVMATLLA